MGMPCSHMLEDMEKNGVRLQLSDFDPHWHLKAPEQQETEEADADGDIQEEVLERELDSLLQSIKRRITSSAWRPHARLAYIQELKAFDAKRQYQPKYTLANPLLSRHRGRPTGSSNRPK